MSLILEVEFLTGAYRGTSEPASSAPDWPPQSDRLFSALVAAWAARGELPDERRALEWLESQDPPTVHASSFSARTTPEVFVPPNDDGESKAEAKYLRVIPDRRRRQARRFPVARPDQQLLAYSWTGEPDPERMSALESLARDVPYLGHSASLTRCRFVRESTEDLPGSSAPSLRRVYPGRLAELEAAHRANPVRPTIPPGASVIPPPVPERGDREQEWLVLELVEGCPPDLRAAALVCRLIRVCLMSGYRAAGMSDGIPDLISGHTEDGRPTRNPHLAIVPLAFTGSQYADGKLHGVALIPPRGTRIADLPGFRSAFMRVAAYEAERERRVLTLAGSPLREPLQFSPVAESTKWSLSPLPYRRASRIWGTVTPIVLDRHLKRRGPEEVQRIIAASCRNAGLPEPDTDRVQIGRHSCFEGAPPAGPQRGRPPWTRWRVPDSFATRSLFHAVIDFGEEVEGPVLLGAGRFVGLGLCRALQS